MSPLLIDPAIEKLQKLVDTIDWKKLAAKSVFETVARVYAKCPPPQHNVSGEDAANYLHSFVPLVQEDILTQHNSYGPVRWLWYLRRVPDSLFTGSYKTTLGYDRLLAEVLSSHFTGSDESESPERVSFRVDESAFRQIIRYVARVKLLSDLHTQYRRIGKGAVLDASRPLLKTHTVEAIDQAIRVYDTRHDRSHKSFGSGLGLVSVDQNFNRPSGETTDTEPEAILSFGCTPSIQIPLPHPNDKGEITVVTVSARHLPEWLNLKRILSPLGTGGGTPAYLADTAALIQMLMLIPELALHVPWTLSSIAQQGYVFVGEQQLSEIVERNLPGIVEKLAPLTPGFTWPSGFIEWRDSLLAVAPSTWPLSGGNVLRRFKDNFLIDVTGATRSFLQRLELSRSPLLGNLRAEIFELQCQELIDNTVWRPPSAVSVFRGRTLRRGGKDWTDIDAIGSKGRTLLVVSCKSIIYDRDYDQGVYKVIRNAQTTIDDAVVYWQRIVSELTQQPTGDNFDFSQYDTIIGVVCTPFPVYSSEGRTLAFVAPNLRASSAILELRDWLESDHQKSIPG